MTPPASCPLLGKWRLTETDEWDKRYLDLAGPAFIRFDDDGQGEMAFGALQAGLSCDTGPLLIFFSFEGFDEMDPIHGSGTAELLDDGSLELEISIHLGDDITLKARRW